MMASWKEEAEFKTTFELEAGRRLKSVVSKLVKTGNLKQYDDILKLYLEEGIAEEAPSSTAGGRVRYLPHHLPLMTFGSISDSNIQRMYNLIHVQTRITVYVDHAYMFFHFEYYNPE